MRSADPAAYDQFSELTSGVEFNNPFRALYLTNTTASTAGTASFVVTQLVNGTATTKTIIITTGTGQPSFLLPISGEKVTATTASSGAKIYALI